MQVFAKGLSDRISTSPTSSASGEWQILRDRISTSPTPSASGEWRMLRDRISYLTN
jgi:hypothetical protein